MVGDGSTFEIWSRLCVPWIPSGILRVSFDPNQQAPIRHPLGYLVVQLLCTVTAHKNSMR